MIHSTTSLCCCVPIVAAWLVSSPLFAQASADQSGQAPLFRVGPMVDAIQPLVSEPPAARLDQWSIDPSAARPHGREASFRLSQADAATNPPPIGATDGTPDRAATKLGGSLNCCPLTPIRIPRTGRVPLRECN